MIDDTDTPGSTIRQILRRSDALISRIARGEMRERVVVEEVGEGYYVGRVVPLEQPHAPPAGKVKFGLPVSVVAG